MSHLPTLRNKTPLIIDFETHFTSQVSLKRMSLRRYIAATHITALSVRFAGQAVTLLSDAEVAAAAPWLAEAFQHDDVVVVAHNNPFDVRVAHYKLGLPWPKWSLCTLDLARASWPNLFQSYSLDSLSRCLRGMPPKLTIDLRPGQHSPAELAAYVSRDAEACEFLYHRCLERLPDVELALAAMTSEARSLSLVLDQTRATAAIDLFTRVTMDAARDAALKLGLSSADYTSVFGLAGGVVKSVKPHAVKQALRENLGFHTSTISVKKINPEKLRHDPTAGAALRSLGKAGTALSNQRRVTALTHDTEVDLNLRYAGSHTYRWTSTGEGKGVNFLNLPKHDPVIAKPLRQIISVKDRVLVRGDAAALEYRMVGWWTKCPYVEHLYLSDMFADPYIAFGKAATGVTCGKKDPIRKVWKETVLGLGFLMRVRTHAMRLAQMLATEAARAAAAGKTPDITIDDFRQICQDNKWSMPQSQYLRTFKTQSGLDEAIIAVAHHTWELFHHIHPEIQQTAAWIRQMLEAVAGASDPERALRVSLRHRRAPDPSRVRFEIDDGMYGPSIKVTCGPWVPTLRWSHLGVRRNAFGEFGLCTTTSRGDKSVTDNLTIENITQAMGRNAMAFGLLKLWCDGWFAPLNVHDEGLIACPPDLPTLLRARDALSDTFRPGGYVSGLFDWACVMDPQKITLSRTLWDEDPEAIDPDLWGRVARGDATVLDILP